MRLLVLTTLALVAGCTAMLLGSGSEPPAQERSAGVVSTDAQTTAAVRERLGREPGLSHQAIGVSTNQGRVTLTGSVNTYTERNLAAQVASSVPGVGSVDNRIRVRVD
jgi:osmotically-inducible protein OsmY